MEYVTHHDFYGESISGLIALRRGDKLNRIGCMLYRDGKPICVASSLNGTTHFARNDDSNGLERGDLTHEIAYGNRRRLYLDGLVWRSTRYTPAEVAMIDRDYPQFDCNPGGEMIFSDEFFMADIETLRELANKLNTAN